VPVVTQEIIDSLREQSVISSEQRDQLLLDNFSIDAAKA
jgi:hypothetical protein